MAWLRSRGEMYFSPSFMPSAVQLDRIDQDQRAAIPLVGLVCGGLGHPRAYAHRGRHLVRIFPQGRAADADWAVGPTPANPAAWRDTSPWHPAPGRSGDR